jgi:hypothetical protein
MRQSMFGVPEASQGGLVQGAPHPGGLMGRLAGVSDESAGSESSADVDRSMSSLAADQLASRFRASCEGGADRRRTWKLLGELANS